MAKIRPPHLGNQLGSLGEFIGAQRRAAELTLRQLAEQTGVSNPYLSQIERGLRKPSAEVLQQLSKALRVSAETLYVRAGILDPQDHPVSTVEMALLTDTSITERQRRVLMDVYSSFVKENEQASPSGGAAEDAVDVAPPPAATEVEGTDVTQPGLPDTGVPDTDLTGAIQVDPELAEAGLADPDLVDPDPADAGRTRPVTPTTDDPLDR